MSEDVKELQEFKLIEKAKPVYKLMKQRLSLKDAVGSDETSV